MTYWDIQTKIIVELRGLGFHYKLFDRLPIFRIYRQLTKLTRSNPAQVEKCLELMELLEWMVALRREGLEPELASPTRYVGSGE